MSNPPWTAPKASLLFRPVFWLTVLFAIFQAGAIPGSAQSSTQTTNFEIGTTVQQSGAKRFGVNLASQNYYDSGQMLRNLTFMNPGFEGEIWQSVVQCIAATSTTCQVGTTYWPANFLQGGSFEVISGAANGAKGTVASSAAAGNFTMTFSAPLSPAPAAGDWLIVRAKIPGNAQSGWWTSTSGGATLSTDTSDIAPDSPGTQALEVAASGSGQAADVSQYFDSTNGRSFIQLNGSYTINFKAKGLGGNNQLNLSIERLTAKSDTFLDQNVTLTNQWQDYSYTFNAAEDGSYIGPVQVSFNIAGASIYLDDVALTEAAAADNPTPFRNAVVDRLRQLRPGIIRYMDVQDFGDSIDNALAVPFARQRAGYGEAFSEEDEIPIGLHEVLTLCQAVGAEPWYTMPVGMTTTEMQNLIQYLSGDASTPYGAIRAKLGQSAPWTSVFPVIHLELGNEVWNMGTFPGEAISSAAVYGNRAAAIFAAARATPGYNPSSFDLILGSQEVNTWITGQEMANSSGYDSVDIAPYIFGTFDDASSNEAIYGSMFAEPEMLDSTANGYVEQQAAVAAAGKTPAKLDVYEVNLGTSYTTAPQSTVTTVVGSVGGAIAVADHMLLMLRDDGVINQDMYALSEYENGIINPAAGGETMPLWGSTIDMGGETNANRPTFLAEQLANSAILPTMLAVTTTGANPTWNQPLSTNDSVQLNAAHDLQSFAFTDGTHNSVVVFNLSRTGSLPVTFSGANAPSGDVLVSQLTSKNITDNNENLTSDTPVVNTTQTNVSNFNPATPYSLPPFSMTVFLWPGSTLPPSTTTLTANPTSGTTGQSITLTATVTSQSGTNTPGGTVSFLDGTATIGTASLDASGVATLSATALPAGTDSITASYGGDTSNAGSTSAPVTVTITSNAVPTATILTASPTSTSTGQTVTLTATVALKSGSTIPSGNVNFINGTSQLGTVSLNASGIAIFTTTALPAGTDSITASYAGNSNDAASLSTAVTVNVTQTVTTTTTALVASATQVAPGQNVTFTATVTPQSGAAPAGTVTFLNGTTNLGTGTLNSSGVTSFSTTTLPTGTNSITASYGGSSSNSKSVSSTIAVTVSQAAAATTTTLTASPAAINLGQSVTFTAKVAAQSGSTLPTGTVAFMNGSTILGTGALNASGIATFSTTALPAGTEPITASYGGSSEFNGSVSAAVTVTVTQTVVATTTTLISSATQIIAGQNLTLTATVAPQSGTVMPAGTVTFLDGTAVLGAAPLSGSGMASFSTSGPAAGSHTITASYGGNTGNSASTSGPVTITVASAPIQTVTSLTSSAAATNTGQSVTFTAAVTPKTGGGSVPILPVAFLDGSTIIGTANVTANGIATFTTTSLPAGTDSITASYTGNKSDLSSVSAPVVVVVTQSVAATTTTLTSSAAQVNSGESVFFTAVVAAQSGGVSSGTVTFLDGATVLGTSPLSANGTAFLSTASLTVGNHSITAAYGGSASDSKSVSTPVAVAVAQSITPTTTVLTASSTQVSYSGAVMFTAVVAPQSGSAAPQGTVAFLDGSTILATAQLNASGAAIFNTSTLGIGTHLITASYGGSSSNSSSVSAPVAVTVAAPQGPTSVDTTTFLTASSTQPAYGQNVTFTATIVPEFYNGNPTGLVTFTDGSANLGAVPVNFNGTASFSTSSLAAGTHSIVAAYSGNGLENGSTSQPVTVVVSAASVSTPPPPPTSALDTTATTLTASASQVTASDPLSFSAAVARPAGGGIPAGTVQFLDGQTVLGTSTLDASGTAGFTTAALAAGAHSIMASYSGDSADAVSSSAAISVTVAAAGTPGYTMAVSTSDVVVTRAQVANLTVTLTPENGFHMPVNLTCSGLPAGMSCSFSPPTVTPNGAPVSSTLSILAAPPAGSSATARNSPPRNSAAGRLALGLVMPWGILSLLGLSTRKNRSRLAVWSLRLVVALVLAGGSLWISGCGYATNSSVFTMTLTSSGTNVPTHTSQITVNIVE